MFVLISGLSVSFVLQQLQCLVINESLVNVVWTKLTKERDELILNMMSLLIHQTVNPNTNDAESLNHHILIALGSFCTHE